MFRTGRWGFFPFAGGVKGGAGGGGSGLPMKSATAVLCLLATSLLHANSAPDVRKAMKRAEEFSRRALPLVIGNDVRPFWTADGKSLFYRVNSGTKSLGFQRVELADGTISPAFDAAKLAAALGKAAGREIAAESLPLEALGLTADGALKFHAFGKSWRYDAARDEVGVDDSPPPESKLIAPEDLRRRDRRQGGRTSISFENATAGAIEMFWLNPSGGRKSYGKIPAGESRTFSTFAGHMWLAVTESGEALAAAAAEDSPTHARISGKVAPAERRRSRDRGGDLSPDGKWRASIRSHNVFIEPVGGGEALALSEGGSEGDAFTGPFRWSPDSKLLLASRVKPVALRQVYIVQSSPPDQLQPKLKTLDYAKPGDEIVQPFPHLFDVAGKREIPIDHALFANPWQITEFAWAADSAGFSFVYNQRGNQVMRIVGVGADGAVRTIYEDTRKTFIDYSQKFFLRRLPETHEILWASERDGLNHLYLLDDRSGEIKSEITPGNWIVRDVVKVDVEKRQLLLKVLGASGQDPYNGHFVGVGFDGSGLTRLTEADGDHRLDFSPDGKSYLDVWSRPDQPPVTELRRAEDGKLIAELARADDSALTATGWSRPERFVAKGRDGKTDIYGLIIRPTDFDPKKSYPVVENIYAGPQDFYVPKGYLAWSNRNAMAELGFLIVQIDGMGTNWRSKDFHDVCYKNLMDGGFPDRVPWIKAAAATRPWMDLNRVGIYGGSAGGQNALAGLLDHGDFYKTGVADCGCHDNRMDKIWWNEAWMGWPVDASYAENSNVTHAGKLTGKLLLVVGEVDSNVDPASTMQVVGALQRAGKDFEFMPIVNSNHGAAETPYGSYRRAEFLVRNLGAEPAEAAGPRDDLEKW